MKNLPIWPEVNFAFLSYPDDVCVPPLVLNLGLSARQTPPGAR